MSPIFIGLKVYLSPRFKGLKVYLSSRRSGSSFGTGLVRHCPQGLFSPFFTFLCAIYFSARLDFSSSALSAPGSPRIRGCLSDMLN